MATRRYAHFSLIAVLLACLLLPACQTSPGGEPPEAAAASKKNTSQEKTGETKNMEKATFGAGCFWGVEQAFRETPGVKSTTVGYAGGHTKEPTYKDVCSGKTGHAEVVEVEFDPNEISYENLLEVFWANHNPTTLNRQGPDIGEQYRSVIMFHSPEQEAAAKASKEKQAKSGKYKSEIVTQIVPAKEFYRAEDYHQQYLEKRGMKVCH